MYERSAIVLERYFEKIFGFQKENNLKTNYQNYNQVLEEIKEYQKTEEEEEEVIRKFDEIAKEIEEIQRKQEKLHESNVELEEERNKLFSDLSENTNLLDSKLQKIEVLLEKNSVQAVELRERYVKALVIFTERQKERNKYARVRRTAETNHIQTIENANKMFTEIEIQDVQKIKKFVDSDKIECQEEIINLMTKNGKNEKVPFHKKVIEEAVKARIEIAEKEAVLYVSIYERTKRLLIELNNETVKLARAEKALRDASVKLAFLNAQKEYIVGFLDNERMTAMNGKKAHEKLMTEACKNFELDMVQINNLYELILREVAGKSTKKAYKELYNKTYLKEINEKEKSFEEEMTNIKIRMGTVINSNYWRIEGIKNIYEVFQEEVSEKFEKDLSEYTLEEIEETILPEVVEPEEPKSIRYDYDEEDEENNDDYYDDDEYHDEYDDEYDDEDDEYEEDDDEDEYDDDQYDDDEYDDDEYDDDEADSDEYEDDDEEDEDNEDDDEEDADDDDDDEYEYDGEKEEIIKKSKKKTKKESNETKGLFKFFKNKK